MARILKQDTRICEFFILRHDKEVVRDSYASRSVLNITRSERFRLLKGTLVCRSPSKPPYSDGSRKVHVRSLDDENLDFDCPLVDLSPLQPAEKDLLIAVSSREERFDLYRFHNDCLTFGLCCKAGDWVYVRLRIDGNLGNVAGVVRYKGELPTQQGIRFGVELEEFRGAGTTDGMFRNQFFFACQQDCGVFVPINKIKERHADYDRTKRHYTRTQDVLEVDALMSPSKIDVGQRVRVYTDEGEKEGIVLYCGTPPGAKNEFVGIEMDHPVKLVERNDGRYEGRFIFHVRNPKRTILCPKASVLPLASLDQPGVLTQLPTEPMETSTDAYNLTVGSRVYIDTQLEGLKFGRVIWIGIPAPDIEKHVGIELDDPCTRRGECNDGTCNGKRLFIPEHIERTVLVPATSVVNLSQRSLSSEPIETSTDPFDFTVGSRVYIDTQFDGLKFGRVIWIGIPARHTEKHVGIELDVPCTRPVECNDGTYNGKRLFIPEHIERTVLVPATSVVNNFQRSLSSETVKDSLSAADTTYTAAMDDSRRIQDPAPYRRHYSDTPGEDVAAGFEHVVWTDVSDAIMSTSPGKSRSAPAGSKYEVCGKAVDPVGVRVRAEPTSSATDYVSTHTKYGQTSTTGAITKEKIHTKDSSSKTVAVASGKRENKNWITSKFPKSVTDIRFGKNETEGRPSMDSVKTDRNSVKSDRKSAAISHRTSEQGLHGRVVSKFTLLDDILDNVVIRVHANWKTLAENMGFTNKEITQITDLNSSAKQCTLDMLYRWREQMSSSRDKLGPLVKACQKSEFRTLANELEQGLDEQRLHHIAGKVHESVWNVLGNNLGLSWDHLSRLQMEDSHPSQRVYNMLLDWRLTLKFSDDKPLLLAQALSTIGMDELVLEVCRGLTAEVLENLVKKAKDFWKRLGKELGINDRELRDLEKEDDVKAAYDVILTWKRRQESGDLLGLLSAALRRCDRPSLADYVVKGMDNNLLEVIANMVEEKQHSIANALDIPMQEQFGHNDSRHSSQPNTLRLLQWWRAHRAMDEAQGQRKLYDVLMKYGFKDAADMVLPESQRPQVLPESQRPQVLPDRIPHPKGLDDGPTLGMISHMNCSPMELANRLSVSDADFLRIKTQWHDVNRQKFLLLRNWINRNENIYTATNLGWQLCKILLEMKMDREADFLVPGSPAYRRWFQETDFATYQENLEEENAHYNDRIEYPKYPEHRVGYDKDCIVADKSPEAQNLGLDVESVVEVKIRGESHYGVIKSLNTVLNYLDEQIAGIELEEPIIGGSDGSFEGTQYFICGPRKAVFVYLSQCRPDSRFPTTADTYRVFTRETSLDFGSQESPIIEGYVEPQKFQQSSVGENKGIQGDQNSCYLDVTLYSMFSFNLTFDPLLSRPKDAKDVEDFEEIQTILREKIVNPLRQHGFVRADRVRDLRLHLDKLGLLPGMTNEEKDPEELLHMLVRDVLKAQPLIKTRHGDTKEIDSQYLYQIFMEKNDSLQLPRVEQLLHQSFLDNELKLVEIPKCLIVQMPRFGKDYKMYRRILPSLTIDITDLLENYPRQCTICGELAKVECRDCRPDEGISEEFIKSYCHSCCDMTHSSLPSHRIKELSLNPEIQKGFEMITRTGGQPSDLPFQRQKMELFAVVCIQTSHYVAFVKTETEPSHWVFFDSMADRDASTVPGFNIPKVTHLKDFEKWLKYPQKIIDQPDDKKLPEHLRRLLGDAYICLYRRIEHSPPQGWSSGATNY